MLCSLKTIFVYGRIYLEMLFMSFFVFEHIFLWPYFPPTTTSKQLLYQNIDEETLASSDYWCRYSGSRPMWSPVNIDIHVIWAKWSGPNTNVY